MQTATRRTAKTPLIGIIGGTSEFGRWFKFFFERHGCRCLVAGRKTALTPDALSAQCDIVIVSVPIRETAKVIRSVRRLLKPGALLADFTSLKSEPLKEMLKADKKVGVLGMHPLFGPTVSSIKEQNIVFCPGRSNRWTKFLKNIFAKNGAKIISMTADEHDKQMAVVQALTHFTNIVFARVAGNNKITISNNVSTPVFRAQMQNASRVLNGDASLYADIELRNPAFRAVLNKFIGETKNLSAAVTNRRTRTFESIFRLTKKRPRTNVRI